MNRAVGVIKETGDSEPSTTACRLHDEAMNLRSHGQLKRARASGQQALAILEKALGSDHPDVGNVLNHLGEVELDAGHYSEAGQLFRRAVSLMRGLAGDKDLGRIRVQPWNDLGAVDRIQGRSGAR